MSTSVNFPYQFDGRGRTQDALRTTCVNWWSRCCSPRRASA